MVTEAQTCAVDTCAIGIIANRCNAQKSTLCCAACGSVLFYCTPSAYYCLFLIAASGKNSNFRLKTSQLFLQKTLFSRLARTFAVRWIFLCLLWPITLFYLTECGKTMRYNSLDIRYEK